jgi:hypothetical protein
MAAVKQARKRRRDTTNRLVLWLALAAVVLGVTVYWARQYPNAAAGGGWVAMILIVAVGVGALFEAIRLVLDARRREDMRTNLAAARQTMRDLQEEREQAEECKRRGESQVPGRTRTGDAEDTPGRPGHVPD